MKTISKLIALIVALGVHAEPNWEKGTPYPLEGRNNPFEMSHEVLQQSRTQGLLHSLHYPVSVTGIIVPYQATKDFLEGESKNPLRKVVEEIFRAAFGVKSLDDLSAWLGLHPYPQVEGEGVYFVPFKKGRRPEERMGLSLIDYKGATGFTYSCATCHSGNLFGKKVLGMTNRFPRANHFFIRGKKALKNTSPSMFKLATGATSEEKEMFKRSRERIKSVSARKPIYLGLDTSLAHVAMSLAHRNKDPYATFNEKLQKKPRKEPLRTLNTDSKPAVWWNVKYKNRWLLDGSVVSGNPILTNLLWNEIGRGTDLKELEQWIEENENVIQELTNAVFNSEAPRYEDFFDESTLNLESAKRGEQVYIKRCAKCHGNYIKAWSLPTFKAAPWKEQIKTVKVEYFEQTPVLDVGTDITRAKGMESLVQLNDLAISQKTGVKIEVQKGYVPPPLVGIWARWPYMHNNSVPNLCELLKVTKNRVKTFWAGPAEDKDRDFDQDCVGYPTGDQTPKQWKTDKEKYFNARIPGLSNAGHDKNIIERFGEELLTPQNKKDLISFLKTL